MVLAVSHLKRDWCRDGYSGGDAKMGVYTGGEKGEHDVEVDLDCFF